MRETVLALILLLVAIQLHKVCSQGLVYQKLCCEKECWFHLAGMLCWGFQSCDCTSCKCVSPPVPPTPPPNFCQFRGGDPSKNEPQPTPPPEPCPGTCYAAGDPFYTMNDGGRLNFQGNCRYLLAAPKSGNGLPEFSIEVQNQKVIRNGEVKAFTKEIIIDLKSHVVILKQHGIIEVDGEIIKEESLPLFINGVSVNKLEGVITFNAIDTPMAFFLQFEGRDEDGRHLTFLSFFDDKFRAKLEGLCGNWNSVAVDDFIPKDGVAPASHEEVGNSWKTDDICL